MDLKTVANWRDFGGYPAREGKHLRKGRIYRSGDLDRVSRADLHVLQALPLKTIVDLRTPSERRAGSGRLRGVQELALPFDIDSTARARVKPFLFQKNAEGEIIAAMNSVYADMVDYLRTPLGELLRKLLAPDSYPVLIHCRAGKDRTGFACAVIQLALGVEPACIIQDYLASNDYYAPRIRRPLRVVRFLTGGLIPTQNFQTGFLCHEEYIDTVLDQINGKYGGIEPYLEGCGLTNGDIQTLQDLLLEM